MSIVATLTDQFTQGKRIQVLGTLAFSGNYTTDGVAVDLGDAGVLASGAPLQFLAPVYRGYLFEYVPGTSVANGKIVVRAGTVGVLAEGTLTSDATNVSDGELVTIAGQAYKFVDILTGAANEVQIGADAEGSLVNLKAAINDTGTPGTDYGLGTVANVGVVAGTITSTTLLVTARGAYSGTRGNALATTETSAHLTWGGPSTLASGVDAVTSGDEIAAAAFPPDLLLFSVPFAAIFNQLI